MKSHRLNYDQDGSVDHDHDSRQLELDQLGLDRFRRKIAEKEKAAENENLTQGDFKDDQTTKGNLMPLTPQSTFK